MPLRNLIIHAHIHAATSSFLVHDAQAVTRLPFKSSQAPHPEVLSTQLQFHRSIKLACCFWLDTLHNSYYIILSTSHCDSWYFFHRMLIRSQYFCFYLVHGVMTSDYFLILFHFHFFCSSLMSRHLYFKVEKKQKTRDWIVHASVVLYAKPLFFTYYNNTHH